LLKNTANFGHFALYFDNIMLIIDKNRAKISTEFKNSYICNMKKSEIESRISELNNIISQHPESEEYWIERGNLHWKMQDWSKCISDFDHAIALNPASTAIELRQMTMKIISFYNKDQYNP